MKFKRARLQQILVFTILSLGLIASLVLVSKNQEIRREAAAQGGFTFAVISDTHAGIDPSQFANFHKWANYNHTQAVKQIITINPVFYLHLGDMVEKPTTFAWGEFFNIEKPLINNKPIYPTIGNHERYHEDKSYFNRFRSFSHLKSLLTDSNKPWYSFDYGDAHFISLRIDYDNYNPSGEACKPGSPEYQWLENDLKNTSKPWKIVFFHVTIYSSQSSAETRQVRSYLHPLFKKYGVQLVLSGHNHFYERVVADGITYITAGGGNNVRAIPTPIPQSKKLVERNHVVKITINNDTLKGTAISTQSIGKNWQKPGGQTLDTFSLTTDSQVTPEIPGTTEKGTIQGNIWIDNNSDGQKSSEGVYSCSETQTKPKLSLYKIGNSTTPIKTVESGNGYYKFTELEPAKYHLKITSPTCNQTQYSLTKWRIKMASSDGAKTDVSNYCNSGTCADSTDTWTNTPFWSLKVYANETTYAYFGLKPNTAQSHLPLITL
ncbi:MAG TPA: metallophosphoesterase [Patescibacteria group bacterium]|nr:metallophosphoesterase [Patescibacteria group bacterium]